MKELNILLQRYIFEDTYTISKLFIDGKYFCDVLEDKDRMLHSLMTEEEIKKIKVHGETAIPIGTYKIDMNTISPRFSTKKVYKDIEGKLPRLIDVKGFSGILIHIGNYHTDTEGCLLVGVYNAKNKMVSESTKTFNNLYKILEKAKEDEYDIYIKIERKV